MDISRIEILYEMDFDCVWQTSNNSQAISNISIFGYGSDPFVP
jgi:hypothetical protein